MITKAQMISKLISQAQASIERSEKLMESLTVENHRLSRLLQDLSEEEDG